MEQRSGATRHREGECSRTRVRFLFAGSEGAKIRCGAGTEVTVRTLTWRKLIRHGIRIVCDAAAVRNSECHVARCDWSRVIDAGQKTRVAGG